VAGYDVRRMQPLLDRLRPIVGTTRWDRAGIPQKGWTCIRVTDLGEAVHRCDMCGKEEIRYMHTVTHPDFHVGDPPHVTRHLDVGCVCVMKMTEDYVGPKRREAFLRSRSRRRATWLTRKWRVSWSGNESITIAGLELGVCRGRSGWHFREHGNFSRESFATSEEAKLALFDVINPASVEP
jgi:hypothetical protein